MQVMPARLRDVTTAQFDLPFEDNGRAQTPQGVCQRGRKGGRRSLILVVIAPTGGGLGRGIPDGAVDRQRAPNSFIQPELLTRVSASCSIVWG